MVKVSWVGRISSGALKIIYSSLNPAAPCPKQNVSTLQFCGYL